MKTYELAVIFCYHRADKITMRNLECLKRHNPDVPVILVSNGGETMTGSMNTSKMLRGGWKAYRYLSQFMKFKHLRYLSYVLKNGVPKEYYWNNADLPLYMAFDSFGGSFPAERVVFMEWDCYCNTSLKDFYSEVWNADLAARHVIDPAKEPEWAHFRSEMDDVLSNEIKESLCGIAPLAGILLSRGGLRSICAELKGSASWRGIFCELRIATIARHLGLSIMQLPDEKSKFLRGSPPCWHFDEIDEPAVWHMVKS